MENISLPPSQTKKSTTKIKKSEKMPKERKSNQNIAQTRTHQKKSKNRKIFFFCLFFSSFVIFISGQPKSLLYPPKSILYSQKSFTLATLLIFTRSWRPFKLGCNVRTPVEEEEGVSTKNDDAQERHNVWNDLLTDITDDASGYRIQQSLEDEKVARVGCSCRFALDCLCTEMHELFFGFSWVSAPSQELFCSTSCAFSKPCLVRFPTKGRVRALFS